MSQLMAEGQERRKHSESRGSTCTQGHPHIQNLGKVGARVPCAPPVSTSMLKTFSWKRLRTDKQLSVLLAIISKRNF